MVEIHRLHEMLTDAGIEHEWRDRTPPGWDEVVAVKDINWGWQVMIRDATGKELLSAIEGYGSYGYGLHGEAGDLIEIWGFKDDPQGYLTAEEVFRRIKNELVT
jgi:hypothetical protein